MSDVSAVLVRLRRNENGDLCLVFEDVAQGAEPNAWTVFGPFSERAVNAEDVRSGRVNGDELSDIGLAVIARLAANAGLFS